ncbi:DNA-3-methyladenine glycosylase family protein [Allorhizocola rhizosphaerae]|uniref:DNA-3-methyladenine glycosylase family protein n=1 Tax=Allorhizocola rhizosphaerae TaxID=1872709 RepID=UPI000E3E3066|nr:DNA-3-methyladenine glycosylase [Allorhizocola rhizosphaerae]
MIGFGRHDPCARWIDGAFWLAARTPNGPGTIAFRRTGGTETYGPGGDWLAERAPGMLGLEDDLTGFDPSPHPLVQRLAHEHQGVRFPGTRLIFHRLLRNICEQKVTGTEAYRGYSAIVRHFKERAPGPRDDLLLPPEPERVAATPYYVFHPLGVEQKRADAIRRAAFEMPRLQQCQTSEELTKRLVSIPGIGPWTASEVVRVVFGDPDAVSVGDFHLKNIVSWALAGEPRGTDERMLELLEPFRGHRGRVILLLEAAGIGAPRYGPRMPIREFKTW